MKYDYVNGGESEDETLEFFSIGDLIKLAEEYPKHIFSFVGTNLYPCELQSWRGSYCLPSITYTHDPITGEDLAKKLDGGLSEVHRGYKGGEYTYYEGDEFYISAHGVCEEYKVVGYVVEDNSIILNTKIDKY